MCIWTYPISVWFAFDHFPSTRPSNSSLLWKIHRTRGSRHTVDRILNTFSGERHNSLLRVKVCAVCGNPEKSNVAMLQKKPEDVILACTFFWFHYNIDTYLLRLFLTNRLKCTCSSLGKQLIKASWNWKERYISAIFHSWFKVQTQKQ